MMYAGPNGPFDGLRLWGAALFFTLALPGLFESTRNIRWMNTIGDLSYPVYLVHLLLILLIGESLFRVTFPTEWLPLVPAAHVSIASFLAVSIVAAAAVHWFLEKPVAAALQYLSGGRPKLRPAQ